MNRIDSCNTETCKICRLCLDADAGGGLSWYMRLFTGVAFLWQGAAALNWIQLGSVIPLSMVSSPSDRRLECSERSDRR